MRVSVASTGGGTGSASTGKAARRKTRYSSTGSTTHPSVVEPVFCATPTAVAKMTGSVRQSALIAIAATIEIVGTIAVVDRVVTASSGFDRGRREVNMPNRF